ncbi:MAG: cob(I)yrinic acid a,c-diamide adenosyltransferase [Anaerolineae bacterium]|nr:cob(I)yrinic acid a,c-diamide adenosyltransferase [Anaerolineae bacterium]
MKIYTRTGDEGQTSLFAGGRVDKDALRLHAYGTVDELNAHLGLALAHGLADDLAPRVAAVQNDLFVVGADLATPLDAQAAWITRTDEAQVERLEHEIDAMEAELPALHNFILPGGSPGGAALHVARTVCRRAERWVVSVGHVEALNPAVLRYVNRLSDWLFVAARFESKRKGAPETTWTSPHRAG